MQAYHQQCTFDGQDLIPIQWLWLLEKSLRGHVDAPPLHDLHWRFNIAQPLTSLPQVGQQQRRDAQPQGPREATNIKLQFATANGLTLFPSQQYASNYMSARAEQLDHQFHDLGVHFIGLQETRSRQDGHFRLPHYHVLSAPASQRGVGGVQLWVHQCLLDGRVKLEVDTSHLHILHATAPRLVVRFSCQDFDLFCLSCTPQLTLMKKPFTSFGTQPPWQSLDNIGHGGFLSWLIPIAVLARFALMPSETGKLIQRIRKVHSFTNGSWNRTSFCLKRLLHFIQDQVAPGLMRQAPQHALITLHVLMTCMMTPLKLGLTSAST